MYSLGIVRVLDNIFRKNPVKETMFFFSFRKGIHWIFRKNPVKETMFFFFFFRRGIHWVFKKDSAHKYTYGYKTVYRDAVVMRISVRTQEQAHVYTSPLESPLNS